MSFSSEKKKDYTLITFTNGDKNRYLVFVLLLSFQVLALGLLSFYNQAFENIFMLSFVLGICLSCVFLYFSLRKKILLLSKENLVFKYKIFGLTVYQKTMLWKELSQIAVEFTRLKAHDILFQIGKKTMYLGESLSEEKSDSLLKEIQLFHFYYLSPTATSPNKKQSIS